MSSTTVTPDTFDFLGGDVTVRVTATDPDGDSVTVTVAIVRASDNFIVVSPTGLTAQGSTFAGVFSLPRNLTNQVVEFNVVITVSDGVNAPIRIERQVTMQSLVQPPPPPPVP